MWTIKVERKVQKELDGAPKNIQKKFEKWVALIQEGGVEAVAKINGYRDHTLSGKWEGARSSSLNDAWRVIYTVQEDTVSILVVRVSNHDYS